MSLPTNLPGCGAPATTVLEIFTRTGHAYSLDGRLNVCAEHIASAMETLRAARFEPHEVLGRTARCGDGFDYEASKPLTAPAAAPAAEEHGFGHSTSGAGKTVTCTCGFETASHKTEAAAADEWRAHAGLPPVRPDLHPIWCDELHEQEACVLHVGSLGMLLVTDEVHVSALLDDSGEDRGLVVTVGVLTDKGETNHRIPLDLTPKPGRRTRKQHALTIERTNGDHLVWRCACGEVFIQDASDARILPALVDHATGGAR